MPWLTSNVKSFLTKTTGCLSGCLHRPSPVLAHMLYKCKHILQCKTAPLVIFGNHLCHIQHALGLVSCIFRATLCSCSIISENVEQSYTIKHKWFFLVMRRLYKQTCSGLSLSVPIMLAENDDRSHPRQQEVWVRRPCSPLPLWNRSLKFHSSHQSKAARV